ncbi:hypothetical protein EPN42_01515 [bacterium]|nr:MAG: hypothetical protein EPN42_01515 [bacterium]
MSWLEARRGFSISIECEDAFKCHCVGMVPHEQIELRETFAIGIRLGVAARSANTRGMQQLRLERSYEIALDRGICDYGIRAVSNLKPNRVGKIVWKNEARLVLRALAPFGEEPV